MHIGLDSHLGGIETYLLKISSHIDRERFQFDFLSYKNSVPYYYEELKALGCNFHFITSRRDNYFKNQTELSKLLKIEKYDIVHCHLNSLSYITPCLLALKAGSKVIVHSRNAGCLQSHVSRILHRINYFRLPKKKIVCAAVSDYAGKWMFGSTKFKVLNNGIDIEKFRFNDEYRQEIRDEFSIDDSEEVILNVGAFRPQKNHNFILQIFQKYISNQIDAKLLFVGDGPLLDEIKLKVSHLRMEDKVIFVGARNDVYKFYSAADKLLFPSLYEGFPNVLLEAETSGLQCVISDVITKQAVIPELCISVSLDVELQQWCAALEKKSIINRSAQADYINSLGFGVDSEMRRLEDLYKDILNK